MADKGLRSGKVYYLYNTKQKFDCYQPGECTGHTKIKTILAKGHISTDIPNSWL